jgi:hypothetical protein
MTVDSVAHEMSITEIAGIIAVEVEEGLFGLADALRTAAWYALEIDPSIISAVFGDAAVLCGLHRQGARNRFNEARNQLVEFGELAAA